MTHRFTTKQELEQLTKQRTREDYEILRATSSRRAGSDYNSGNSDFSPQNTVEHFHTLTDARKHRNILCVQYSMLSTYLLVCAEPRLNNWLIGETAAEMAKTTVDPDGISALALGMFSKARNQNNKKFDTVVGKLWVSILERCVNHMFLHVIRTRFDYYDSTTERMVKQGGKGPQWLAEYPQDTVTAFSELHYLLHYLSKCNGNLQQSSEHEKARKSKKRRGIDGQPVHENVLPIHQRWDAVKYLNNKLKTLLNSGRNTGKLKMFDEYNFLVWIIQGYTTPEDAKADGYWISIDVPDLTTGLRDIDCTEGGAWDLPNAKVGNDTATINDYNHKYYNIMINKLPYLRCTLNWRRKVIPPEGNVNQLACYEQTKGESDELIWNEVKEVEFHEIALTTLIAMVHADNASHFLRTTPYSLKVIRNLATGMFGRLAAYIGIPQSNIEQICSAATTFNRVTDPEENLVSIMAGDDGNPNPRQTNKDMVTILHGKKSLTWEMYLESVRKQDLISQTREHVSASDISSQRLQPQESNVQSTSSCPMAINQVSCVAFGGTE